MSTILRAGTLAPDFGLYATPNQKLSLRELRGKPVILAFYPADWSPVCGDQMSLYNDGPGGISKVWGGVAGGVCRWRLVP